MNYRRSTAFIPQAYFADSHGFNGLTEHFELNKRQRRQQAIERDSSRQTQKPFRRLTKGVHLVLF